jgi:hypothetical protein
MSTSAHGASIPATIDLDLLSRRVQELSPSKCNWGGTSAVVIQ